ncbi:MAG: hypothetical protein OHK0046_11580 [Anaerolineae bacterium]
MQQKKAAHGGQFCHSHIDIHPTHRITGTALKTHLAVRAGGVNPKMIGKNMALLARRAATPQANP